MTLTQFIASYDGFNKHFRTIQEWNAQYNHFRGELKRFWRAQGYTVTW